MADITNLTNFLGDIANAIRTKKETTEQIPAENFDQEILSINTIKGQEKTIIPSTAEQIITPDGDYNAITKATIKAVDNTIDSNISPENIKKDINILGVTGTLEEGEQINNQDKEITTNGTYTADEGYTGLGTVTVNVPQGGGSGDVSVKLFKTVEALNADETIKENDLAVVYDGKFEDLKNGGTAMYAYFPKTVVLETPITESISINFSSGNGNIDATSMYLYDYNNRLNISYSSEDGITYTGGSSSVMNIKGYTFSCSREDIIPAFIKTSTLNFEGIYKATTHKSNYVYNIANYSSLDSSNKFTYIYTGEYADKLVLRDALLTAKKRWPSFDSFCFYLDENKNIYIARPVNDDGTYPNGSYWCGFNSDGTPFKGVITNVGSKLEIYKYLPNTSTLELFTTAEKTSTYSSHMSFATSNAATLIMMRLCT